jgi:hypothetical protein
MCTDEQKQADHAKFDEIIRLLKLNVSERPWIDTTYSICDTQGFYLDYKDRKHLYLFSANALTLNLQDIGTLSVSANTWTDISFRQGLRLFTSGTTNPVLVYVRATDETISSASSGGSGGTVTQGTPNTLANAWPVELSDGTNLLGTSSHPVRNDPTGTTTQPVSGTVTANAGTNLNTSALALESGGNLQTLAGGVSSSLYQENLSKIAGNSVSTDSGTSGSGTQRIIQAGAATGTKSNVASSASSVTILASNTSRKGAVIYNDSTQILYLDLSGGTASNSSYSVQVPAQGYFELPGPTIYNGAITGIWASANGNARVTEFS